MRKASTARSILALAAAAVFAGALPAAAQVQFGGDFMMRAYAERFQDSLDDRDSLNYMRFLGRIYMYAPVSRDASLRTDFVTLSDNPVFPARSIAGTGTLRYSIAQIYADLMAPGFLCFDVARFRLGRQQFQIGEGLALGESYYLTDGWDGVRGDFSYRLWTLSLFGAITGQNLSDDGYYPRPGSDQLYVAKLEYELFNQTLMGYAIYDKRRGVFNDNMITGLGSSGSIHDRNLRYFVELAHQEFHTLGGLPEKSGLGYMAGLSYSWSAGPFRTIKAEVRTAGYQGDDATTDREEIFSPVYPTWWWGDRTGYANGSIGGNWPNRDRRPEGSRVWYGRVYVSPTALPKARLQLQYVTVSDWVNNDGYNENDDEFAVKLYYQLNDNVRLQGRYVRRIANGDDVDVSQDGTITSIEDRVGIDRYMLEFRLRF